MQCNFPAGSCHHTNPLANSFPSLLILPLNNILAVFAFLKWNFKKRRNVNEYSTMKLIPVNSILDWNDNFAAIFEAKLTFNGLQVQSLSIVFVGAVDTIFLGMYQDLMFLF